MTTSEELNADFDRLSVAILKVKRDRDALLEAAKAALRWIARQHDIDDAPLATLEHAIAQAEQD